MYKHVWSVFLSLYFYVTCLPEIYSFYRVKVFTWHLDILVDLWATL